jgi:hypothetical protein
MQVLKASPSALHAPVLHKFQVAKIADPDKEGEEVAGCPIRMIEG